MKWVRNSHCGFCGMAYVEGQAWPRTCDHCEQVSYLNPLPVAVAVVPVDEGILLVRRAIPPREGQLALPGGYIDLGESWQTAAAREVFEETGVIVEPAGITLLDTKSAPDGTVLVFGLAKPLRRSELAPFVLSPETSEVVVVDRPVSLAFPLHTTVLANYFAA